MHIETVRYLESKAHCVNFGEHIALNLMNIKACYTMREPRSSRELVSSREAE